MSLSAFLTQLALTNYQPPFASKGISELEHLTCLSDTELDGLLSSLGMLKGHAFKLKKALENAKSGPVKRPRPDESPIPQARPSIPPTGKPGVMLGKPGTVAGKPGIAPIPPPKPTSSLTKEVERLISKLGEIEQVRDDIQKAKEMILAIDLDRYRRGLDQVEFIQRTMGAMEEVTAEMAGEAEQIMQEAEGEQQTEGACEYPQE